MIAKILDVTQYGSNVTVCFSVTDDNGNILKFPSFFNSTPCVQISVPIQITSDPVGDTENLINSTVQSWLNNQFIQTQQQLALTANVAQISSDLVNTTTSVLSITVGSVQISNGGIITSIAQVAQPAPLV